MDHKNNPFSISKANDLTDKDIQNFWVDGMNFESFIEPKVLKPKFVIGGKGSGKTHLMRYFSYEVQIESKKTIEKIVTENGYIGVFIRASTLFGSKFLYESDSQKWMAIFYYYFELFITYKHIIPILKQFVKEYPEKESNLSIEILSLFDTTLCKSNNLLDIESSISKEIKDLNSIINNYVFDKNLINSIDIKISKSSLLFGIPTIIKKVFINVSNVENLVFNYFIDEFENFEEQQQKYIQTLVRESGANCTFRLGIRTHAYSNYVLSTEHSTESNRVGSELSCLFLDEWLMNKKSKYEEFILKIIQKKYNPNNILEYKSYKEYLRGLFLQEKKILNSKKAFSKFKKELQKLKISSEEQSQIIDILKVEASNSLNTPLLEKINIYKFYKLSKDYSTFLEAAIAVSEDCANYMKGVSDIYKNDMEKQKENMLAQLFVENNYENSIYLGLSSFIKISFYNPRHFINLMGYMYDYSEYYDNNLVNGVSEKIQIQAIQKLLSWFEDDYDKQGKYGYQLRVFVDRLCRYFEARRFNPKPSDTSTTSFYIKNENYSNYKEQIKALKGRSILVEKDKNRPGKNAGKHEKNKFFRINYVYSEKYKLPLIERGSRELKSEELQAFFAEDDILFNKVIRHYQKEDSKLAIKEASQKQGKLLW